MMANSPVVVGVPVTDAANVKRVYPRNANLAKNTGGLRVDSIAKTEQIRGLETSRFVSYPDVSIERV